jgi:Fur family zinc uptake transcriptional regulator
MPQAAADAMKLTRNQELVLSTLEDAAQPLSAYGILDRLREHGLRAPLQSTARSTTSSRRAACIGSKA